MLTPRELTTGMTICGSVARIPACMADPVTGDPGQRWRSWSRVHARMRRQHMLTHCSRQHKLTVMEKTFELAEGATSKDPEVGLRAVAALRVLTERLEMLQV